MMDEKSKSLSMVKLARMYKHNMLQVTMNPLWNKNTCMRYATTDVVKTFLNEFDDMAKQVKKFKEDWPEIFDQKTLDNINKGDRL
tara:strand:+ start:820 stop:1074 length:255 start_codon:yes stop_codon:yes gene_type:complete